MYEEAPLRAASCAAPNPPWHAHLRRAGPFFEASDFFDYVGRKVGVGGRGRQRCPAAARVAEQGKVAVQRVGFRSAPHQSPASPSPCPCQGCWDERDPAKRIPSPLVPGLLRFFKGVICAALWMKLSAPYGAGEWGGGAGHEVQKFEGRAAKQRQHSSTSVRPNALLPCLFHPAPPTAAPRPAGGALVPARGLPPAALLLPLARGPGSALQVLVSVTVQCVSLPTLPSALRGLLMHGRPRLVELMPSPGSPEFHGRSFAWAVAESSIIFSGLCYNGRSHEVGGGRGRRLVLGPVMCTAGQHLCILLSVHSSC